MTETALDQAFAAMEGSPEDEGARSRYYGLLATTELFVLLEEEPGQRFEPQLVEMDGTRFVLAFDTDARMGAFCDGPTPYLAMSGRALVETLEGARLGIAVNPGFEAGMFVPPEAVDWMRARTAEALEQADAKIDEILPPDLSDVEVLKAIDARLSTSPGPGRSAYLVKARYGAESAHLMIFVGFPEAARASITGSLAEVVRFVAPDLALDTIFVEQDAAVVQAAARVGLRFDMSAPEVEKPKVAAPGSDPDKPPILH